jgi:anaerobic magnesium-protoporphyrin IX monomethyl ester cyclase
MRCTFSIKGRGRPHPRTLLSLCRNHPIFKYEVSVNQPIYLVAQRKRGVQLDGKIPPFGIMCVGEALRRAGLRVRLFHLCGEEGEKLFLQAVGEERPLWAGFSNCISATIRHDLALSRALHAQGIKVVWGGIFATALAETVLRSGFVDYVVQGEGERPAVALTRAILDHAPPAGIPGVARLDHGEFVSTPAAPVEPDLDCYPMALDLVDWNDYIFRDPATNTVVTSMNISRGCPFGCSFCTNSMDPGRRLWRGYSLDYLAEITAFLKQRHGVNAVHLQDDNPFGKLKEGMKQVQSLGLQWISAAHLQYATPEFLDWARECGCLNLSFGIESGSDRILEKMNKRIDRARIRERMSLVGEKKIPSWAMWMAYLPGETIADRRLTFSLMDEIHEQNPLVQSHLSVYQAYPGTPFYEQSKILGLAEPQSLDEWCDYTGVIAHLMGAGPKQLRRMNLDLRALYYYGSGRNKLSPALRRLLRKRVQNATFIGPLEEGFHYVRLARDVANKFLLRGAW